MERRENQEQRLTTATPINAAFGHRHSRKSKAMLYNLALLLTSIVVAQAGPPPGAKLPKVELERVPGGGIQPQIATARDGTVHLVYFKGDPLGGDLFYAYSADGRSFSTPVRVNSVSGTAVAIGNIRGPRMVLGRRGSVYVAWNGSQKATRSNDRRTPMLYTRLRRTQKTFEPERNLIHSAYGLDGGSGIAADQAGRVFVFWHAPVQGGKDEQARRVWMTRSIDDGQTFEPEKVAWTEPTGACGCCSLNAFADASSRLFVLFRSAHELVHRDMYLLTSLDHGATFSGSMISAWKVGACVMSTEAFSEGTNGVLVAWETEKQVHSGRIVSGGTKVSDSIVGGSGIEKYPSLAQNRKELTLVSWTTGMEWRRGGFLHWQLFNRSGQPLGTPGAANGVPVWSLIASYARRDGNFVVLY